METWYRARFGEIEEIAIERATKKLVVLPSGRKELIDGDFSWWRSDREQAKLAMIVAFEKERNEAVRALAVLEKRLTDAHNA